MPYAIRTRTCACCGELTTGRYPPFKDVHCLNCNTGHMKDAARQMAAKSGPYYDRWLRTRGPLGRPRLDE